MSTDVTIEFERLYEAFCTGSWQSRYYLDVVSGAVHLVTERTRRRLQDVYDAVGEDSAETHLTDPDLQLAHTIEMDDERYLKVPERKLPVEMYDDFAQTCDPAIRRLLWRALDASDFAQFERLLLMDGELQRWQKGVRDSAETSLTDWLSEHNLHPIWT